MKKYNQLNNFEKMELYCQVALTEMLPKHNFKFTTQYASYDAFIRSNKDGQERIALIEMKVRYSDYNDYILESRKLVSLLETRQNMKAAYPNATITLLYLNFTPSGTYVWDLDKVIKKAKRGSIDATRYTAAPSDVLTKGVYYLPKSEAVAKYKYIFNRDEIEQKILNKENNTI